MDIVNKKISDLKPAEYNPRQINKNDFEQLKKSLQNFDVVEPVVVNMHKDRKNVIVGGHQRLKALASLGHKEVPCVEVDLPLEREKELNIRLNKNTGDFDFDVLANFFDVDDLLDWGFTKDEVDFFDDDDFEETDLPELADGDKPEICQQTYTLHNEQAVFITEQLAAYKKTDEYKAIETFGNENSNGNALYGLILHLTGGSNG